MKNVLEQGLIDIALTCENAIGEDESLDVQEILRTANEALRKHRKAKLLKKRTLKKGWKIEFK